MKKLAIIVALALVIPITVQAQTYIEIQAGRSWRGIAAGFDPGTFATPIFDTEVPLNTGWVGSIAVGYDTDSPVRLAVEYSQRKNDIGTLSGFTATVPPAAFSATVPGFVTTKTILAMAYLDIPLEFAPRLTPYVGLGIGGALSETKIDGFSTSERMVAVQMSAGAAFELTPSVDLTVTASFLGLDEENEPQGSGETKSLAVGFRANF